MYASVNIGGSNRLKYDNCNYQQTIYESTSPGVYRLYLGSFENEKKCVVGDRYVYRQDPDIVDLEGELLGRKFPSSKCGQFKYGPKCKKEGTCTDTFNCNAPIVTDPGLCRIVSNNLPTFTSQ
jgi:hypothetical protein